MVAIAFDHSGTLYGYDIEIDDGNNITGVLGGGAALFETSPLQRQFRDAQAMTQHIITAPATGDSAPRPDAGPADQGDASHC